MLAALSNGGGTEAARGTSTPIKEQVDLWVTSLVPTVPRDVDRERYRREVERLVTACGITTASDATFEAIVRYLAQRRTTPLRGAGGARKPKTLRGKSYNAVLSKVRSFFAFACRSKWIAVDPTEGIDWSQEQDSEDGSRAFTLQEIAAMLARSGTPNHADKRTSTDRYYAYLVATATPLRRSTIAKLEWSMFRTWVHQSERGAFPMGEFRLPRKAVKKAKRVQTVPLPRWAVEAMVEWWELRGRPTSGLVFPSLPEHRTILADAQAVGIQRYTEEGGVGWNSFRKFYLTDMATRTMPAVLNELSGHQDIRTTLKFYVGQTRVQAAAAVASLENPENVDKIFPTRPSAQNHGRNGTTRPVDKAETPPAPHGVNLTEGGEAWQDVVAEPESNRHEPEPTDNSDFGPDRRRFGEVQRLSAGKDGRAFSDHRAAGNDPMGIRTPLDTVIAGGGLGRATDFRSLAVELARGLRQVANAVVEALSNEELDDAGSDTQG